MNKSAVEKLNAMFDISGAVVNKTQTCPVGRWVCSIAATLLSGGLYSFLTLSAFAYLDGGVRAFVIVIISLALIYVLFRVWLAFACDVRGARFAERSFILRRGGEMYCYTRSRYVSKFEYDGGLLSYGGGEYENFENKQNYNRLAGRYSKSLQRRSSVYNTLTPSFIMGLFNDMNVTVCGNVITGEGAGSRLVAEGDGRGKIKRISYCGKSYFLFDSVSPLKMFNGKFWGKYKITYDFTLVSATKMRVADGFRKAAAEFLMKKINRDFVEFTPEMQFCEWIEYTDGLPRGQASEDAEYVQISQVNILNVNAAEFAVSGKFNGFIYTAGKCEFNLMDASRDIFKSAFNAPVVALAAPENKTSIKRLDVSKRGFTPALQPENANYKIYGLFKKPFMGKTAVADNFKLLEIYGDGNGYKGGVN